MADRSEHQVPKPYQQPQSTPRPKPEPALLPAEPLDGPVVNTRHRAEWPRHRAEWPNPGPSASSDGRQDSGANAEGAKTLKEPHGEVEHDFNERNETRQRAAAKAHQRIVEYLSVIVECMEDKSEALEEMLQAAGMPSERLKDVRDEIDVLKQLIDELLTARPEDARSLAWEALNTASVIEGDLTEMEDAAERVATASGSIASKTLKRIMKIWSGIARWLWNFISHLLTPKEWSLSGGIQMPGLAHASISVTFGG